MTRISTRISTRITTGIAGLIATAGGLGLSPFAPGTLGSIPGVFLGLWLARGLAENPLFYATLWLGFTAIGLWSVIVFEHAHTTHDDQRIVIDEVMGQSLVFLPVVFLAPKLLTADPLHQTVLGLVAFALFRLFDIWKPGPIGWIDRQMHSPLGTYLDDLVAGVFAALTLSLLFIFHSWKIM